MDIDWFWEEVEDARFPQETYKELAKLEPLVTIVDPRSVRSEIGSDGDEFYMTLSWIVRGELKVLGRLRVIWHRKCGFSYVLNWGRTGDVTYRTFHSLDELDPVLTARLNEITFIENFA